MTLPDVDSLATYGGALADAAAVSNPLTDRSASGTNPAYANVAMATHTNIRAWARFTPAGTGTPVLAAAGVAHDELWGAAMGAAAAKPMLARTATGTYTLTWPATVLDEVPPTALGGQASHALNLRVAFCNEEIASGTLYRAVGIVTAPNVVTVSIWTVGSTPALADPNGPTFAVFAL